MSREPEEPFLFDLPLSGPPPAAPGRPAGRCSARRGARRAGARGAARGRSPCRSSARPSSLPSGRSRRRPSPSSPRSDGSDRRPARGPVPVPRPSRARTPAAPDARGASPDAATAAIPRAAARGLRRSGDPRRRRRRRRGRGDAPGRASSASSRCPRCSSSCSRSRSSTASSRWPSGARRPGMAWCGLIARSEETEPLSFGQTAMRWLGHWLTWLLLGLPGLLALSGRSLADRLSGSSTYETPFSGSSARLKRGARVRLRLVRDDSPADPEVAERGRRGHRPERPRARDEGGEPPGLVEDPGDAHRREGEAAEREEVVAEEQQPEPGQVARAVDPEQQSRKRDGDEREIALRAHRPGAEARAPAAPLLAEDRQALDRAADEDRHRPEDGRRRPRARSCSA